MIWRYLRIISWQSLTLVWPGNQAALNKVTTDYDTASARFDQHAHEKMEGLLDWQARGWWRPLWMYSSALYLLTSTSGLTSPRLLERPVPAICGVINDVGNALQNILENGAEQEDHRGREGSYLAPPFSSRVGGSRQHHRW